jgi:hypothetical protein
MVFFFAVDTSAAHLTLEHRTILCFTTVSFLLLSMQLLLILLPLLLLLSPG